MRVCVECKADKALVGALGFQDVIHKQGKSRVTKYVLDFDDVVGLEDEDPASIESRTLRDFQEVTREDEISVRTKGSKKIVLLCPLLEDWVLRTARTAGVGVRESKYNLPDEPMKLHRVVNDRLDKWDLLLSRARPG